MSRTNYSEGSRCPVLPNKEEQAAGSAHQLLYKPTMSPPATSPTKDPEVSEWGPWDLQGSGDRNSLPCSPSLKLVIVPPQLWLLFS